MLNSSKTVLASLPNNILKINFSNKGIFDADIDNIIDQIKITINNSSFNLLIYINLATNFIRDKGAKIIASTLLTANYNLVDLALTNNNIEDEGITYIADALKENTTLKVLYLNFNYIGDTGALALSNALKLNKSLTFLDVSSNKIQSEGALALFNALELNKTLNSFSISHNTIGDEGLIGLASLVRKTKNIIQLHFTFLYNTELGETTIINALEANSYILYVNCGALDQKKVGNFTLRKQDKFQHRVNEILNNKELTFPEYYTLLYQLPFFINCKQIFSCELDTLKNINLGEVNKIAYDKLLSGIFWVNRVCQTKTPFFVEETTIVLPVEICNKIFSYLDLKDIVHKKEHQISV